MQSRTGRNCLFENQKLVIADKGAFRLFALSLEKKFHTDKISHLYHFYMLILGMIRQTQSQKLPPLSPYDRIQDTSHIWCGECARCALHALYFWLLLINCISAAQLRLQPPL